MASNSVTKDIESRVKHEPERIFDVFLEIHEPIGDEPAAILLTYPENYSDEILKTAANFAYPCRIRSDEQNENFTFVVLDSSSSIFRFGFCRRSNRESTCLCIISYFPWFESFYAILSDLSQIINTRPFCDVETFLNSLYNYRFLSNEQFSSGEGHETIEIVLSSSIQQCFRYNRPDLRKLPSVLSNRNFSVMFSLLGPDLMLKIFSHLLFERRILFVSSKLFHLTACSCACLHLIYPMHWQSIFLPILPENLSWTSQCTAPFILGVHSNIFSKLKRNELGDVIIVRIDERSIDSTYDDLSLFPKDLLRTMKREIEQSTDLVGDQLARVFLRAMAFIVGDFGNGFVIKNDRIDFDRQFYLEQYRQSSIYSFMSHVVDTQMFEQFSRYRTQKHFEREVDVDEFEIEVKNLQRSKKSTNSDLLSKLKSTRKFGQQFFDRAKNPLVEQVQDKAEQIQSAMNKIGIRNHVETAATSNLKINSKSDFENSKEKSDEKNLTLIEIDSDRKTPTRQNDPFDVEFQSVFVLPNLLPPESSQSSQKNDEKSDLIRFD